MSKKRGRPKGSTNSPLSPLMVELSRCSCGSSRRTKYENPERVEFPGGGLDCVAIVYRTCRCVDCGQARRVPEKEYAPKGAALGTSTTPSSSPTLASDPEAVVETIVAGYQRG